MPSPPSHSTQPRPRYKPSASSANTGPGEVIGPYHIRNGEPMTEHDPILLRYSQIITRQGWAVVAVLPSTQDAAPAAYCYTVGLTEDNKPELVIVGLRPAPAQRLLDNLAYRVHHGGARLRHGEHITDLMRNFDALIIDADTTDDVYPGIAQRFYGADRVRWQQIVWPDTHGRFPQEPGYEFPPELQPYLGRP
jgi:hypothetical protein